MLRIIAGEHRGRRLRVPEVASTRPLGERGREALMSHLRELLPQALVWDVYAGSGILGFEALSRGAERVVAVERHPRAARHLRSCAAELGYAERYQLLVLDARDFLENELAAETPAVLFFDPPYAAFRGRGRAATWELFCALAARLCAGGCAAVHTPRGLLAEHERERLPGLVRRDYGSTSLYWWHQSPTGGAGAGEGEP